MKEFDAVVIGAGLLGCFTARALTRYRMTVAVLEAREDVCTGISKANTAIVYDGHDTKPGTMKTQMCVRANGSFDSLCAELGVRFSRCGAIMVCFGPRGMAVLEKKYEQGLANGVEGLRLLNREQVLALEPSLSSQVYGGLLSPNTGTVNPWELFVAAYENARANGARFFFHRRVEDIRRQGDGYLLTAGGETFFARGIVNCAGLEADRVRETVCPPAVRIFPDSASYLVTDETNGFLHRVIFHEPEEKGKGLTLVPTIDGNLLIGPTEEPLAQEPFASSGQGLDCLRELCRQVMPSLPLDTVIRSFGAVRPNPFYVNQIEEGSWTREARSISSFTILEEEAAPGMISLLGIKTPGLTCAWELGCCAADKLSRFLGLEEKNPAFDPVRPAPLRLSAMCQEERRAFVAGHPAYGRIVCRCRGISEGEILDAIRRGAVTVDGVKRRVGSSMGRCQGSFCTEYILELLSRELGVPPDRLCKDGEGTVLGGGHGTR